MEKLYVVLAERYDYSYEDTMAVCDTLEKAIELARKCARPSLKYGSIVREIDTNIVYEDLDDAPIMFEIRYR